MKIQIRMIGLARCQIWRKILATEKVTQLVFAGVGQPPEFF